MSWFFRWLYGEHEGWSYTCVEKGFFVGSFCLKDDVCFVSFIGGKERHTHLPFLCINLWGDGHDDISFDQSDDNIPNQHDNYLDQVKGEYFEDFEDSWSWFNFSCIVLHFLDS